MFTKVGGSLRKRCRFQRRVFWKNISSPLIRLDYFSWYATMSDTFRTYRAHNVDHWSISQQNVPITQFAKNYKFSQKGWFPDFLSLITCSWCQAIEKKDLSRYPYRKTAFYPGAPFELYEKMCGLMKGSLPIRILRWIRFWCYQT